MRNSRHFGLQLDFLALFDGCSTSETLFSLAGLSLLFIRTYCFLGAEKLLHSTTISLSTRVPISTSKTNTAQTTSMTIAPALYSGRLVSVHCISRGLTLNRPVEFMTRETS